MAAELRANTSCPRGSGRDEQMTEEFYLPEHRAGALGSTVEVTI